MSECPICVDITELVSPPSEYCDHEMCMSCWINTGERNPLCPICRCDLTKWMESLKIKISSKEMYDEDENLLPGILRDGSMGNLSFMVLNSLFDSLSASRRVMIAEEPEDESLYPEIARRIPWNDRFYSMEYMEVSQATGRLMGTWSPLRYNQEEAANNQETSSPEREIEYSPGYPGYLSFEDEPVRMDPNIHPMVGGMGPQNVSMPTFRLILRHNRLPLIPESMMSTPSQENPYQGILVSSPVLTIPFETINSMILSDLFLTILGAMLNSRYYETGVNYRIFRPYQLNNPNFSGVACPNCGREDCPGNTFFRSYRGEYPDFDGDIINIPNVRIHPFNATFDVQQPLSVSRREALPESHQEIRNRKRQRQRNANTRRRDKPRNFHLQQPRMSGQKYKRQ